MLSVTILGNNSAVPTLDRHPTAQIITTLNGQYLVDCGEGTQLQMALYRIRWGRINHIFISHLHGDHYFGLIGLLTSFGLMGREHPLHLFGPADLKAIIDLQLRCASAKLGYELVFTSIDNSTSQVLLEDKNIQVSSFPTTHSVPCSGFLFKEIFSRRKILPQKAESFQIPIAFYSSLQEGRDFVSPEGNIVENSLVTSDPSPSRTYAFCADTLYDEGIIPFIQGADLAYHETTYLKDQQKRAEDRYHSTTIQAATLAKKAGIKQLLIGHFSSKYTEITPFEEECRSIFPNTELALEGKTFTVD